MEEHIYGEDEAFDKAELEELGVDHEGVIEEDTNRYDIYDGDEQIYGGHL